MATLKFQEPEAISWDYDAEADVLYLSFGEPQPALGLDLGDGIIARYNEEKNELVGFTFIGIKQLLNGEQLAPTRGSGRRPRSR